jgi:DNA-binding response OmpR family regulator
VEFRLAERKVLVRGREAPITAREMAVLEVLLRRRGHAVARADILQAVWGAEDASAGSLEVLIGRIRRKLGEVGESLLRTHRGYGYSIGEREP